MTTETRIMFLQAIREGIAKHAKNPGSDLTLQISGSVYRAGLNVVKGTSKRQRQKRKRLIAI